MGIKRKKMALENLKEALELHFEPPSAVTTAANRANHAVELGRLKPQPFREIKRRLEAAGFVEACEKGSHVKFVRDGRDR